MLADQTTNATITLSLAEAGAPKPHPASVTNPSIAKGVRQGVAGFIGVLVAVLVGIGYLVPITILALLAWWVLRRTRRRALA